MDQMRAEFEQAAAQLNPKDPQIRVISSVTGRELTKAEITPQYWGRQIRDTVHFRAAMETLNQLNHHTFFEMGPGATLCGLGRQTITQESAAWLPMLRRQKSDWEQTLDALGQYWQRGGEVDWEKFDAPYSRYRVPLPHLSIPAPVLLDRPSRASHSRFRAPPRSRRRARQRRPRRLPLLPPRLAAQTLPLRASSSHRR